MRSSVLRVGAAAVILAAGTVSAITGSVATASGANPGATTHRAMNCRGHSTLCTEVADSEAVFGDDVYVGHDEPSVLFYSNQDGAGYRMRYQLTLPKDPPPTPKSGRSYNFELHPAFWFGLAMCDTQSYPEQTSTCTPHSDANITTDPTKHPGTAFMEMQFYPPGWAGWDTVGTSCDPTKWCAALNIDSLSQNPISGKQLNRACQSRVGVEYVNFAFITKNGVPQGPPNPVESNASTFIPDPRKDLFMGSGDKLSVTIADTPHGLRINVHDLTAGTSGFMTASAANGFGMVKFAPYPSTDCTNIPYDFHAMYATSSTATRVPWAAHSYNASFADEIGHFDFCSGIVGRHCGAGETEGPPGDREAADGDDTFCAKSSESLLVPVTGCTGTNTGFDGVPYQPVWPDGSPDHPTSIDFSSPLTGPTFGSQYPNVAFEADLPRIEFSTCDRTTGSGCTLIPTTDDGSAAPFYPFFSSAADGQTCRWNIGNDVPGATLTDFGKNAEYGSLLQLQYWGRGGAIIKRYNDFRQILGDNPCPQ
jgi:hypothetical protein